MPGRSSTSTSGGACSRCSITRGSRRAVYAALLLAGAVNLTAAVVLVWTQPDRAHDLDTMYRWCRQWVLDGTSLYTGADAYTDYPPNAIPVLGVIALLPWRALVAVWTVAMVALTPLLAYVTVRATTRLRSSGVILPVLLFLSWAAPRTLLQFSVVSMTAAFAAVWSADTRPTLSGLSLGLALAKPHIAAPCFLWTLCTRRWRVAITATLVVLASCAVYAARIPENAVLMVRGYARVIATTYAGPEGLVGLTSIRAWTNAAGEYADIMWIAGSVLFLALACWTAARTRVGCKDGRMIALGTLNLWSLLTFYHNGHNLILMFPTFLYLLCGDGALTSGRIVAIAALQLAMMFDVPTRLGPLAPRVGWQHFAIRDFDRVIALVMFCGLVVAGRRCDPDGHVGSLMSQTRRADRSTMWRGGSQVSGSEAILRDTFPHAEGRAISPEHRGHDGYGERKPDDDECEKAVDR